jgi:hypothetical protein
MSNSASRSNDDDSDTYENLVSYTQQVLDYIERSKDPTDNTEQKVWKFNRISGHQGLLQKGDSGCNGSSQYNVIQVEWENGETTHKPMAFLFGKEDSVSCAPYAKTHDHPLLNTPGWRFLCKESIERTVVMTTSLKSF